MEVSAKVRNIMDEYSLDPQDIIYSELIAKGWGITESAFYAYNLMYDDKQRCQRYIDNQRKLRPGISRYIAFLENEQRETKQTIRDLKERVSTKAEKERKRNEEQQRVTEESLRTKQGMLDYLIELAATPGLDPKMKADIAKQITDLQQYKKEEVKEEDTRIHFHLPANCKYCNRCASCELKDELESLGYSFNKKCQSPLILSPVKPAQSTD